MLTISQRYLAAGADIIETNTFSGTFLAQADYHMQPHVYRINKEAARIAKEYEHLPMSEQHLTISL